MPPGRRRLQLPYRASGDRADRFADRTLWGVEMATIHFGVFLCVPCLCQIIGFVVFALLIEFRLVAAAVVVLSLSCLIIWSDRCRDC